MTFVWIGFFVLILALLVLDLAVLHRDSHVIGLREAAKWSAFWVGLGLAFSGVVYVAYTFNWGGLALSDGVLRSGADATWEYIAGYLIEKSLSVDNIFVMAMLFRYFKVPAEHQHKVLFWGILGALVFRGIMIGVGTALVQQFDWIFYVFGAVLMYAAYKMLFMGDDEIDPESSRIIRFARRIFPLVDRYEGGRFTVTIAGKRFFTLLFLAVVVIELTDIVFAVDSIPAVFGVTQDAFIVMTSNVFAILGLRALYFLVAGAIREFHYLNIAVAVILVLVGAKMILHEVVHIPSEWSLVGVVALLAAGIVASIVANRRAAPPDDSDQPPSTRDANSSQRA